MSEKIRRQKDIIKNSTKSYLEATKAYQNYFDGTSPVSITYYQIADEASRTDTSLEDTREVIGTESSIFYNRIKHVQIYGTSALDINNQLTQRGLESFITGDFVITPDLNINPKSGEFFAFEDENMPELCSHLFIITDVQYDRATSQKFFKCSFKLYPADTDNIYSHVVGHYVYDPNGNGNTNGVGDSVLVTEESAAAKNAVMELRDGLIDKFEELFYDEGMDTFAFQKAVDEAGSEFEYYWSPYVCHFIYKNKILEKTHRDFLTEIFVQDINEREFPAIYSEKGYRGTLFHALEQADVNVLDTEHCTFMEISSYDLNRPLNLPFFSTAEKFYLVDVYHPYNTDFWMGAFDWVNRDETAIVYNVASNVGTKYAINTGYNSSAKFIAYNVIDSNKTDSDAITTLLEYYGLLNNGEIKQAAFNYIMYKCNYSTNAVESIIQVDKYEDNADAHPVDLFNRLSHYSSNIYSSNSEIMKIIGAYLDDTLVLSQSTLDAINNTYYENTLQTYILLPMLIYVLQNYKGE